MVCSRRSERVAPFGHEVNLVRIETKREKFAHPVVGHCSAWARPVAEEDGTEIDSVDRPIGWYGPAGDRDGRGEEVHT